METEFDQVKVADSIIKFARQMAGETPVINEPLKLYLKITDADFRITMLQCIQNNTMQFKGCEPTGTYRSTLGMLSPLDINGRRDPSRNTLVADLKTLMTTIAGGN
ncbi:hypothetical protein BLNAU_2487 [Blattamonas nauphoetae]|uniref:Uncharacterized protein n=1 Tax=Blattamonas nauphoetae TaxID=2049346 RepID=A0ABQ9YFV9_9EUKA|nr:hypothetical protein BLNAU_2487 [Blattamonas nauphoetae]